jgi:hypothetical protein
MGRTKMTEIREANFGLDLPGQWEQLDSPDPSVFTYRALDGSAVVSVTLFGIRGSFSIADPMRILDDYLHHRTQYEKGQEPLLVQSEPSSHQAGEAVEGAWDGVEAGGMRRLRHKVVLTGGLLADIRYEAMGLDEASFDASAGAVLGSATVTFS